MSFKLIAIRPVEGCDRKFLKILNENEFYTFYNEYVFEQSENKDKINIKYTSTLPADLFYDKSNSQINISAIVGKNGSGKSSIMELLYVAIYNLSVIKEIIKAEDENTLENDFDFEELNNIVQSSNIDVIKNNIRILNDYKHYLENNDNEKEEIEIVKNVNIQIYYTIRDEIYLIYLKDTSCKIYKAEKKDKENYLEFYFSINNESKDEFNLLKMNLGLFYNIVNNYSLYGLNSNEIGDWITKIFHKNDGYQTPIVINPMRIEGNIDINTETDLSKSRLLSNVLTYIKADEKIDKSFRYLVKDKIAGNLVLKLKKHKFNTKNGDDDFKYSKKYKNKYLLNILNTFKIHPDEENITQERFDEKFSNLNLVEEFAIEYIFRKIEKIANIYEIEKKKFGNKFDYEYGILVNDFLDILRNEETHITFKLRQAVNFLKYDYKSFSKTANYQEKVTISIDSLSREIYQNQQNLRQKYFKEQVVFDITTKKFKLINFIPPSFFEIDIEFENKKGNFNSLSSGEKQKIFSINTILYHIININSIHSVFNNNHSSKYEYRYINIVFDEIELCFHPEMQKSFINDLLKSLQRIDHINIYMNIVFVTHSPFILSDIPNQNIMYLDKGNCLIGNKRPQKSFGANITDLLSDSFFIEDGLIGDFAKEKINKTLNWLRIKGNENNKNNKFIIDTEIHYSEIEDTNNYNKQLINIIDEPLIKYQLKQMFMEFVKDDEYLDLEIKRLEKLKSKKDA